MKNHVADEADSFAGALFVDLIRRGLERPVYEQGPTDDVLSRHESPIAAVEDDGAIVAHGEVFSRRHDEVFALNICGEADAPTRGNVAAFWRRYCGEVVAIRVVVAVGWFPGLRLILFLSIEEDDAVAQVDAVSGDTYDALDEVKIGLARLEEHDDVAALDVAVVNQRHPVGRRSEGDAVDQDVIADEQGLLHGRRRNLEVLEDECQDEKADDQYAADGGESLEWSFFGGLCRRNLLLFQCFVHRLLQRLWGSVDCEVHGEIQPDNHSDKGSRSVIVLTHNPEHAIPAGKTDSIVCRNFVVSESIILLRFCCRWAAEGEVDDEGSADDILHRNEAPVAAVAAVVAIISEHEIAALGNDQLAIANFLAHLHPPMRIDAGIGVEGRGKLIAECIAVHVFKDGVGFLDRRTVDVELAAFEMQPVSGKSCDALDHVIGGIEREVEDDDVSAIDFLVGQDPGPMMVRAVNGFVHQQEVAHEQGPLHGFRRDAEGLHDEGEDEESDDDEAHQGRCCLERTREDDVGMMRMRTRRVQPRQRGPGRSARITGASWKVGSLTNSVSPARLGSVAASGAAFQRLAARPPALLFSSSIQCLERALLF